MSFRDLFRFSFDSSSTPGSKSTRKRGLKFESLENREMLSAMSPVADTTDTQDAGTAIFSTEATTLATPDVTAKEVANQSVQLTWNAISGAAYYDIWRLTSNGDVHVSTVYGTSYLDQNPLIDQNNVYAVRAVKDANNFSDYKRDVSVYVSSQFELFSDVNANNTTLTLSCDTVTNGVLYDFAVTFRGPGKSDLESYTSYATSYSFDIPSWATTAECSVNVYSIYGTGSPPIASDSFTIDISSSVLSTPTVTDYAQVGKNVELKWNTVSGASSYVISRINSAGVEEYIGTTNSNVYIVSNASVGFNTYTVRAKDGNDTSDYQRDVTVNVTFGVTATHANNVLTISWDAVSGASSYTVWYTDDFGSENWIYVSTVNSGQKYELAVPSVSSRTYGVRAFQSSGEYMGFGVTTWVKTSLQTPDVQTELWDYGSGKVFELSWDAVPNADHYDIWELTAAGDVFIASTKDTSFVDTDAPVGKTTYAVRAIQDLAFSDYKRDVVCDLPFDSELDFADGGGLLYTWETVPGATYYTVWVNDETIPDGWISLGNVNSPTTSLLINFDDAVGDRTYKVEAYDAAGYLAYSTAEFVYSDVSKPVVHQSGPKEFTISWTGGDEGDYVQILRNNKVIVTITDLSQWTMPGGGYYWIDGEETLPEIGTGPFEYVIRVGHGTPADEVYFDSEASGPVALFELAKPVVEGEQTDGNTVTLNWDAVANAESYTIIVNDAVVVEGVTGTTYEFVPTAKTGPQTFTVVVMAVNDYTASDSKAIEVGWVSVPTNPVAAVESTLGSGTEVKLSWTDTDNASSVGYHVMYRRDGEIVGELYVPNNAKDGCYFNFYELGYYEFAVQAVVFNENGTINYEGPFSEWSEPVPVGAATKPNAVKSLVNNDVTLTWTGGTGGSGIQILRQYSTTATGPYSDLEVIETLTAFPTTQTWTDDTITVDGFYRYVIRSVTGDITVTDFIPEHFVDSVLSDPVEIA